MVKESKILKTGNQNLEESEWPKCVQANERKMDGN